MIEKIPVATYRMQFNSNWKFGDAVGVVAYLQRLGVSDIYASPVFRPQKGSQHGYDVVDHSILNPEAGGEEQFSQLRMELISHRMGMVLDIVPNHMGILDPANRWWQDVLENGRSSAYAAYFDIDWRPPKRELRERVLLPFLGDQYGRCMERQELRAAFEDGAFTVSYYDKKFPLAPKSWVILLNRMIERLQDTQDHEDEILELESIVTALRNLPERSETDPIRVAERQREREVSRKRLRSLLSANQPLADLLQEVIAEINGTPGDAASFDRLEELLANQAYRLAFWRVAADEINYRRFFDVNELAAIRVEDPEVFKAVHRLAFELMQAGGITGLRIDHPDGLFNPKQYFIDLQRGCQLAFSSAQIRTSEFPAQQGDQAAWIVVEKILGKDERLSTDWAVSGTTGYEYLNLLNGLFVDPAAAPSIGSTYKRFTGIVPQFGLLMYECKKLILRVSMSSELHVLARRLDRISESHRYSRDFTLWSLQDALGEIIATFPVYRTYISQDTMQLSEDDKKHVQTAIRIAKRRNRAINASVYDFIGDVLTLEHQDRLNFEELSARRDFAMRFQQITGPVTAKGLEDTAFYRAYPLASLNEVGGEPEHFGVLPDEFHKRNQERFEKWPHSLLATSTHDTKRSEDVRARINVISEFPGEWSRALTRWRRTNRVAKRQVDGIHVPDSNEEYLVYQSLVGIWPFDGNLQDTRERLKTYTVKAAREAKIHTSWTNVHEAHETALAEFIDGLFEGRSARTFLRDFAAFQKQIEPVGALNSLAQLTLKIGSPGVPDFYQGCELWDFSLVDPDNRRPVDYGQRVGMLDDLLNREGDPGLLDDIATFWRDGRIKLFVTQRLLRFRGENLDIFQNGGYIPLGLEGGQADRFCAFARKSDNRTAIFVVPRLSRRLLDGDRLVINRGALGGAVLQLPPEFPEKYRNVFSGSEIVPVHGENCVAIPAEELFREFPVAVLFGQ